MGAQQSKEELLYQQVSYGNVEGIKALHRDGAGLEWVDKEGKTPLILACTKPEFINVAKVLIELGANINAYRPEMKIKKNRKHKRIKKKNKNKRKTPAKGSSHSGTPLHHAAKLGLDQTVNLLLSSGANPFLMNDDCQTPLELARTKGHCNVVRTIESRICLFCGWMREINGPSILEAFVPQWVQRKIWAVVVPCHSRDLTTPQKFELAIYPDLQVAQPRVVVQLWKVQIDAPKLSQSDPSLVIVDKASKTRYKFLSANEGDKQQLQWFYNACRGIPQQNYVLPPTAVVHVSPAGVVPVAPTGVVPMPVDKLAIKMSPASASAPPPPGAVQEDVQMTMAINASIQSGLAEGIPVPSSSANPNTITNGWAPSSSSSSSMDLTTTYNGWGPSSGPDPPTSKLDPAHDPFNGWGPTSSSTLKTSSSLPQLQSPQLERTVVVAPPSHEAPPALTVPSAPPLDESFYSGPVQYPTVDLGPIDLNMADVEEKGKKVTTDGKDENGNGDLGSCVICLDAGVEGACVPCGHMAGCMSCLNEVKGKGWGCPVCRAGIDQVVRIYAV